MAGQITDHRSAVKRCRLQICTSGFEQFCAYPEELGIQYDWDGNLTGLAPIMGIAPTPGFKGGNIFIKGFGNVNKELFHTVIKKDILNSAVNYSKIVGRNPDILIKESLIILKGTGPYSGKSFQTGLKALDFFGY